MKKISLNGEWQLRWYDGARGGSVDRLLNNQPELHRALKAEVPGSVHLDLVQAGLLDEPNVGLNVLKARWVEENFWFYRKTVVIPELHPGEKVFLNFQCLDLVAVIYFNGQEVARHANAFYPCQVEVTRLVRTGENVVIVALEAGLFFTSEKPFTGYGLAYDGSLHKRHWLRQTQSTFEWDWSPRLLNVGIRGDAWLEICSTLRLESFTALAELDEELQTGTITCRMNLQVFGDAMLPGSYRVEAGPLSQSASISLAPGANRVELKLSIPKPELWWPIGHGSQPLYEVKAVLSVAGQEFQASRKTGFRLVQVDQSPHPLQGQYFILKVNHQPIFCKGGNLVPADIILARLNRERYKLLIERAQEANFNLLRVWGGGLYENDEFYELCDEKGILVWQEFIFACAKYPLHDEQFLADVQREAVYQVRRLASHPSLVVWCGNNEMEWGAWDWGYEKGVAHPDYALFHLVLPRILKEEDGTRYYQPSSPFSPDLLPPNQDDVGDQHPWSVGFGNTDFRDYRRMICRFPNEGGFLGPTALPTMQACLEYPPSSQNTSRIGDKVNQASPFHTRGGSTLSFSFEIHDNQIAHWGNQTQIDLAIEQWLGLKVQEMSLEDYVYYGGLLQGQALHEYIRNFRRRMFDSASAIFWMYNDCWPATRSWTIIDYYGRRTPSFYPVRRAFQPLAVFLASEENEVKCFGVNETFTRELDLEFGLVSMNGAYPLQIQKSTRLAGNASSLLASFPLSKWEEAGIRSHCAYAILRTSSGEEVSRDILFLPYFKEMEWPKAKVDVKISNGKAFFTCDVLAWRVCLDLNGVSMPDNYFDILPGIPTILDWPFDPGFAVNIRTGNLSGPP
jgi:beta-mannosidase